MVWALKADTAALARQQAGGLKTALLRSGLTLDIFRVFNNARPVLPANAPAPGVMLDVQA